MNFHFQSCQENSAQNWLTRVKNTDSLLCCLSLPSAVFVGNNAGDKMLRGKEKTEEKNKRETLMPISRLCGQTEQDPKPFSLESQTGQEQEVQKTVLFSLAYYPWSIIPSSLNIITASNITYDMYISNLITDSRNVKGNDADLLFQ